MKKINSVTYTYKYNDDFMIDIVQTWTGEAFDYEAWIYNKDYGVKDLMFGSSEKSLEDFIELAEQNAPEYITTYMDDLLNG